LREASRDSDLGPASRKEADDLLRRLVPTDVDRADAPRVPMRALSEASRFWLLEKLCRFLRQAASDTTRVLVLDDLHWADDGSLDALTMLSNELPQTKLLVIGTARDTTPSSGDGGAVAERLRRFVHMPLYGLDPADIASYLRDVTGEAGPPELTHAVHMRTAGNPLFLREAASLIAAQRSRKGHVRPDDVELPQVARGFLRDRLATFGERARSLLDAACVMGDEFDVPVLGRVTGFAPNDLLAGLDEAVRARFVVRQKDTGKYAFVHALMREILYDALSSVERTAWHGKIALALESLAPLEPRLNELACHFHNALPAHHEQAMHYCRLAGNASLRVCAFREAAQFYGWALTAQQCAPKADARVTCELLIASAVAHRRPGRVAESLQQCRQAIELARREGFADLIVAAAGLMRPTVSMAQLPDPLVLEALEHALTLLPAEAKALRAHTYARLSCIPPYANRVESSRELSQRAVVLARETGRHELLIEALGSRFHGLSGPDHIDDLLDVTDEVLRLDAASASWWTGDAFVARYLALLQRGDMAAADRALESFGHTARELRIGEAIWQYERFRAQQSFQAGDFAYAEARFNELAQQSQELSLGYGPFFYVAQLNALSVERTGKSLPRRFDQTHPLWKMVEMVPSYRAERILYLIQGSSFSEARVAFAAIAKDDFGSVTQNGAYLYTLATLALAATELGEKEAARALYQRLRPYPDCNPANGFTFCLGSVSYFMGVLAGFLDRPVEAEGHLEDALAMNERLGYEPHVLRTQLALADVLRRSPSQARRLRARALVSEVRARAHELGMAALAARCLRVEEPGRAEIRAVASDRIGRS
jgi:tetratricopeptide (TPR) repeat protein